MHLVIQGAEVETRSLKELAKLARATAIEAITPNAFRLIAAAPHPAIEAHCANDERREELSEGDEAEMRKFLQGLGYVE